LIKFINVNKKFEIENSNVNVNIFVLKHKILTQQIQMIAPYTGSGIRQLTLSGMLTHPYCYDKMVYGYSVVHNLFLVHSCSSLVVIPSLKKGNNLSIQQIKQCICHRHGHFFYCLKVYRYKNALYKQLNNKYRLVLKNTK